MRVHHTAAFTAVWRRMGKADAGSIRHIGFFPKIIGYILGLLEPASISTISQRTLAIDSLISKIKPMNVVEIGAGYSSRQKRFPEIKFYELDLPYISKRKEGVIPFDIGRNSLNLQIKEALFIVEGVTMYLSEEQVKKLLKQIKKYKGNIAIDFFSKNNSIMHKNIRQRAYKFLFKLLIGKSKDEPLFDFRVEDVESGKALLKRFEYRNVNYYPYNLEKKEKTPDCLFYAEL